MARSSTLSVQAPATMVETFGQGIISDADKGALSPGQLTDCTDWMLDKPGVVYKRGGSTQLGGSVPGAVAFVDVAEFPALGAVEQLAWSTNLNLYRNVSGTWTSCGAYGVDLGHLPRMRPCVVADNSLTSKGKLIWGPAGGTDYPIVYEGGGAAPRVINAATGMNTATGTVGRYMAFYKGRVVMAASTTFENRVWFSPDIVTGVETAWDLSNAYLDVDYKITGLVPLQNTMLIFSRNHTTRLSGTAAPPGGNMSQGPIGDVGCTDSRSISVWNDTAIWANPQGVYASNGTGFQDLTLEGGIKKLWKDLFTSYNESSDVIAGSVYKQYYIVSVKEATTFILDIPRRTWWKVAPFSGHAHAMVADPMSGTALYVADLAGRVTNWSTFFSPSSSYRTDVGGTAPAATLTTRIINAGMYGLKAWRDGRLHYNLTSASSTATGTLTATESSDGATLSTNTLAEGEARDRVDFDIAGESEGVQVTIAQSDACDSCELYGMELDYYALPLSMGGAE